MNILDTQFCCFKKLSRFQFDNLKRKSILQFGSCTHLEKRSFHIVMKKMLLGLIKLKTNKK